MTDNLKLVGTPEQPVQPTYPHTNIQFGANGFALNIMLADDIVITKIFNAQTALNLHKALGQWKRQREQQIEAIRHIEQSKIK